MEGCLDILGHGDVHGSVSVIPIKSQLLKITSKYFVMTYKSSIALARCYSSRLLVNFIPK